MYQNICVDIFSIYKLYKYPRVGFSVILHNVANNGEPIIFTHIKKHYFKILLLIFNLFTLKLGTITGRDITHQTIFIQFYVSRANHVGSTQQAQFALYCTILLKLFQTLDKNTCSLLNTKRCSV